MKREKKNLLIVVLAAASLQLFTVLHYEQKLNAVFELAAAGSVGTGMPTANSDSAIALIKRDSLYQGDSIWIDEENRVRSSNKDINSTIEQMYVVEANLKDITARASRDKLPVHYVVYKTAIGHYLTIYKQKPVEQQTSTR